MSILFVNNATTVGNEKNIFNGPKTNSLLSTLGKQQATHLGECIEKMIDNGLKFAGFYTGTTSDLKTVDYASDYLSSLFDSLELPGILDSNVKEINVGDLDGEPRDKVESIWHNYVDKPFPNGESWRDAIKRNAQAAKEAIQLYDDGGTEGIVIVVGSQTMHKALNHIYKGTAIADVVKMPYKFCEATPYGFSADQQRIYDKTIARMVNLISF